MRFAASSTISPCSATRRVRRIRTQAAGRRRRSTPRRARPAQRFGRASINVRIVAVSKHAVHF
jgi:hypothetical protein